MPPKVIAKLWKMPRPATNQSVECGRRAKLVCTAALISGSGTPLPARPDAPTPPQIGALRLDMT